jgi:hypothetical protein
MLKPLTDALKGAPKKIQWTEEMQQAFEDSKKAVANTSRLVHPEANAEISLATDASNSHVGAVLQQRSGGDWLPLAFFSKKLNPAQMKYSTFDRELLAIVMAIRQFHFFLEGRFFTIFTDHKPLTTALHRVSTPISARQQRCFSYIAEFSVALVHTPGKANIVADALSRPADEVNVCVGQPVTETC